MDDDRPDPRRKDLLRSSLLGLYSSLVLSSFRQLRHVVSIGTCPDLFPMVVVFGPLDYLSGICNRMKQEGNQHSSARMNEWMISRYQAALLTTSIHPRKCALICSITCNQSSEAKHAAYTRQMERSIRNPMGDDPRSIVRNWHTHTIHFPTVFKDYNIVSGHTEKDS